MEKARKHVATRPRRNFQSTTLDQLRNATEKMTEIDRSLMNVPLSDSVAVEIGLSVRQSAEDIVKEKELIAEILCHIIFDSVRFHGIAQAVEVFLEASSCKKLLGTSMIQLPMQGHAQDIEAPNRELAGNQGRTPNVRYPLFLSA